MSKKASDSIMAGLQDALAYTKGDKTRGKATAFDGGDLDVGKVRGKVGLSQDEFARAFGVSVGTLRNWEQNRVRPDGPARSEEHTSELQSRQYLVCRLLLEK